VSIIKASSVNSLYDRGDYADICGFAKTDAIHEVLPQGTTPIIYDVAGRRVMQPAKGLYIVNGRKVLY